MKRLALPALLLLAGCIPLDDSHRREDPWDKYVSDEVPEGNIRVDLTTFTFDATDGTFYEAAAGYRGKDVTVVAGGLSSASGATLFAGKTDFIAAFRTGTRRSRTREERTTFALVADGLEAELRVTNVGFVPVRRVIPIYRGAVVIRTIEKVVTGTGLYVQPTSTDRGTVRVRIIPFLATQDGGWGRPIRITELSTTVEVHPGQPLVLMAHDERRDSFAGTFLAGSTRQGLRRVLQVLTVRK